MPERGLYWVPQRPHQAFYIEHQNNRAVIVVLAFDEQGHAEWFTASGELQVGTTLDTEMSDRKLYHYFRAPLARVQGGPVLGFSENLPRPVPTPTGESIGTVTVNFTPDPATYVDLQTTLPGGPIRRQENQLVQRFNYGFGGFGRNAGLAHDRC